MALLEGDSQSRVEESVDAASDAIGCDVVLVAIGVIWMGRSRWRWLALVHPMLTTIVIVMTANHYWTDAIVASLLVATFWGLASWHRYRKRIGVEDSDRHRPPLPSERGDLLPMPTRW